MKKTFLSVLIIAMTLTMLSSCVFVERDDYSITCYNDTYRTITDWCVKKNNKKTYANDDRNCTIYPGYTDTIYDLSTGDYRIYFSFKDKYRLHEDDYESTGHFWLDEDVTFYVAERDIYGNRSALSAESDNKDQSDESELVIVCSNGQVIPLEKVSE